jgi:hypothetical protein
MGPCAAPLDHEGVADEIAGSKLVRAGAEVSAFPRLSFTLYVFMPTSTSVKRKPPPAPRVPGKPGRPATGTDPLYGVRISSDLIAQISRWSAENDVTSRSEAIRRLLELGLSKK